ncbi:MAG TPA: hypothetical protein DIT01_00940 [Lentisphaeria bacterium]|nr:hypothetical protein [Lentisphaeria bacterium]
MNKKDIAIVVICLLLLFGWMKMNTPPPRPPPDSLGVEQNDKTAGAGDTAATDDPTNDVDDQGATGDDSETPVITAVNDTPPAPAADVSPLADKYRDLPAAEPVRLFDEGTFVIVVDPNVGGIKQILLLGFAGEDGAEELWVGDPAYPMLQVQPKKTWKFSNPIIHSVGTDHVTFSRLIYNTGLILQQTIRTNPETPYGIITEIKFRNTGTEQVTVERLMINCGTMLPLATSRGFMGAGGIDQRVDLKRSDKDSPKTMIVDKIAKLKKKVADDIKTWDLDWMAVQNKYFTTIVSSQGGFEGCELRAETLPGAEKNRYVIQGYAFLPEIKITGGASEGVEIDCFAGPKRYSLFEELDSNEKSIMQFDLLLFFHFGLMEWISLLIFNGMLLFKSWTGSYGLAIICLTIVIRTLFWPITYKSTVFSKKLQKIQPEAKEIREKYKEDPQRMQKMTFDLYRKHKINPLSGCLPVFLQIPVFFALFNVLRSAIELRQEGFLWAADLSKPDTIDLGFPLNPLAILMGLSMMLQQKLMPTSVDPAQQKMMMFMSLFFVFLLYTMPSGLTLYWTVNQVVSMFQYWVTHKIIKDDSPPLAETAKA